MQAGKKYFFRFCNIRIPDGRFLSWYKTTEVCIKPQILNWNSTKSSDHEAGSGSYKHILQ